MDYALSIAEAWTSTIVSLRHCPRVGSRVGGMRESINYSFAVHGDIRQPLFEHEARTPDAAYFAAELAWYLSGDDKVAMLLPFAPSYAQFADHNGDAYGAYGYRMMHRGEFALDTITEQLRKDELSRQAVVTLWRPGDLQMAASGECKDIPCTLSLQFLVRSGPHNEFGGHEMKLHLIATMRSNDVWIGLPYDYACFTAFQAIVAHRLGVGIGSYYHQAGSMHIYDKHEERASAVRAIVSPAKPVGPDLSEPHDFSAEACAQFVKDIRMISEGIPVFPSKHDNPTFEFLVEAASAKING